ncbi:hypothetical protein PpBr36_04300, partial [Pyricularia pennisetigena]|uniref:hypothetical protein n=1 Tax=Pyricularia pennisetigena TaxID=1578925 RepID=UPI001153474E
YARNAKHTGGRLTHRYSGQRRGPRKCWRTVGWARSVLDLTGAAWALALRFGQQSANCHRQPTVGD